MKYLRLYEDLYDELQDHKSVEEIIVDSFDCELGTFTYLGDREPMYIWTDGTTELVTGIKTAEISMLAVEYDPDGDGIPFWQDGDDNYIYHEITAVGDNTFTCDIGTFTYDRMELGRSGYGYFWVKDDTLLATEERNPRVNDYAYDDQSGEYEITDVHGEVIESKYQVPWVSYCNTKNMKWIKVNGLYYAYIGERDCTTESCGG